MIKLLQLLQLLLTQSWPCLFQNTRGQSLVARESSAIAQTHKYYQNIWCPGNRHHRAELLRDTIFQLQTLKNKKQSYTKV